MATNPGTTQIGAIRDRARLCGYALTVVGDTAELFDVWLHVEPERVPSYSGSLQGCADWLDRCLKQLGERPEPSQSVGGQR